MSRRNCSHISSWLTVFFLGPLAGFSQSSLLGKITDRETGEPVPYANVFFSHTTMGSATLEDGTFIIRNIPNGKFDLMVFVVGYKRFIKSLEFQDSHYKLDIALRQDTINLETVTVHADQADKKFYPSFEKYFLVKRKMRKNARS